jgi:hypothetical protein
MNGEKSDPGHHNNLKGVRSVVLFDAAKGLVIRLADWGMQSLLYADAQAVAGELW